MTLVMSRILILGILAIAIVVTFRTPRGLLPSLREFLTVPSAPLNLAILRVVVFSVVLQKMNLGYATWLSAVPGDLLNPPWGMAWIVHAIPPDPAIVKWAGGLLSLVCVLGIAGFGSRTCAAIAAAISVYVHGVPQCIGKVAHYNHLVWFLALLAVTPCGDALSVDSLIHRRRTWREHFGMTAPSTVYGFPLRVAALLIGCIYFFPGFWKIWESGAHWIMSDNLPNLIWRYGALEGIHRANWLADYPALLRFGGAAVLLFELGFIFALFWSRLRSWAVAAGVLFHVANWYVLNILFHPLLACYVLFVDWAGLANRIGLGRAAIHADVIVESTSNRTTIDALPARPAHAAIALSLVLFSGVVYAGSRGITEGWPFACYPTFAGIDRAQEREVSLDIGDIDESQPVDIEPLRRRMGPVRWERWITWILDTPDPEVRDKRLLAFTRWCIRETGISASAGDARLFDLVYHVNGGQNDLVSSRIAYAGRWETGS